MIKVDFYSAGCENDMRTDLRLVKLLLSFSFAFFVVVFVMEMCSTGKLCFQD